MKIKWDAVNRWFRLEFQDFQSDLDAAKSAKFKTTGPPDWIWYSKKIKPLDYLRKNRPASGLIILKDALDEYTRQKQIEEVNEKLKAELKEKQVKIKIVKTSYPEEMGPEGFKIMAGIEYAPKTGMYQPPEFTGPKCRVCNGNVYFYELQDPPTCIYCEKMLDKEFAL